MYICHTKIFKMKKSTIYTLLLVAATLSVVSCKQEAVMPSDAEIAQKVQDKYGAELSTLKELKKMQCEETLNQEVSKKLSEATVAAK